MDNKRIENKLMWMNVDPWDSYRWLAEHVCKLEDENAALRKEVAKLTSTNSKSMQCRFEEADCRGLIRYCSKCGTIVDRL